MSTEIFGYRTVDAHCPGLDPADPSRRDILELNGDSYRLEHSKKARRSPRSPSIGDPEPLSPSAARLTHAIATTARMV